MFTKNTATTKAERATRRFEMVCLAIAGHTYKEIGRKVGLSPMRVQQMIEQQAGRDFYPQLTLERRKKEAKILGFMKVDERKGVKREGLGTPQRAR